MPGTFSLGSHSHYKEIIDYKPRFYLPSSKAHTARYIPVRLLTGKQTSRYRAVPQKSTVGGRLRKKKGRGKEERRRGKVPRPRAVAARGRFFSPRDRGQRRHAGREIEA
ncbi:hypothetical protein BHM03_00028281, partial [Ensete ventricosum]